MNARPQLKPLSEQVIVITGASSGIGLATAQRAARAGAKVVLVARGASALEAAVTELVANGFEAAFAIADVADIDQVRAAAALAVERFGRIDTWVSNAGVAIYSDLLTTPREEHERLLRTNYWGAVNSAEVAVAELKKSGGALVTVGSIASDMGSPVMGAYVASKHAVKGFIDSLRIELNRDGVPVQVSLIKPAGVGTPLTSHIANHKPGEAKIPPPAYDPELVADAILHAASHPVREQIIGGAGAAQVLVATLFPGLFAKIGGMITPLLNDLDKAGTATNNLFSPMRGGATRGAGPVRHFSLYTIAQRHPLALVGIAMLGSALTMKLTAKWQARQS